MSVKLTYKKVNGDLFEVELEKDLGIIDLNHQGIASIDLSPLASCANLRTLELGGNELEFLDLAPLLHCSKLKFINLNGNQLKDLDLTPLQSCTTLEEFIIGDNELRSLDLSPLSRATQLRGLHLSYNLLTDIDLMPIGNCSNLRALSLSSNRLERVSLTPLRNCTKLVSLGLVGNKLEAIDLSPLRNCTGLTTLNLWRNKLEAIDLSPLRSCIALEDLSLSENKLKTIDLSPLVSHSRLMFLSLNGNSLEKLDITPIILLRSLHSVTVDSAVSISSWIRDPYHRKNLCGGPSGDERERVVVVPQDYEETWELLHRLASIPHDLSIPTQTYIVNALGFSSFGFLDTAILDFLCSIPPGSSLEDVRAIVRPFLIEKVCEQIDRGGTTVGLDVETLAKEAGEVAMRIERVTKLRDDEIKGVEVERIEATIYDSTEVYYFVEPLIMTAYGFSILRNFDFADGLIADEDQFLRIQAAVEEIEGSFSIIPVEYKSDLPTPENMSSQMRHYLSGLIRIAWRSGLTKESDDD